MRIGIDLHAIQAPSCRGRGIGRYAKSLIRALLVESPSWEFIFYRRPDLGLDWDHDLDDRISEWVAAEPDPRGEPDGTLQQVVQRNPQGLDWLLIPNPVVERRGFALPEPVPGGPRLAAVVHDFIPALFPNHYLQGPKIAEEYARDLRRLRSYDLLLANSEATRRDGVAHLGVPDRRTANLRAAADRAFFRPAEEGEEAARDAEVLGHLGLAGPFLYYLGNVDWRKNVLGLLDAYALIPGDLRERTPLVLTFGENEWFRRVLAEKVEALGLQGAVVATGPASDEAIRALCRRCELFLSPSLYEGFGLPILEAMSCGAAVVVADNSSQPEVAGPAGALAKTGDARGWAETIADLLRGPGRVAAMRRESLRQAATFSWEDSARRLRSAVEKAPPRDRRGRRVAIVAYPSAGAAGFDGEAARIFDELRDGAGRLVFLDADRASDLPPLPVGSGWHSGRVLGRLASILGDPQVLHLVDSLEALGPLIEGLRAHPGVVVFGNPGLGTPSDLVRGAGDEIDDGLREIVRLASGAVCRSEWLHQRLSRTAGGRAAGKVHRYDAAEGCAALLRITDPGAVAARMERSS